MKTLWKAIYTLRHKGDNQRKGVRKRNLTCKSLNYLSGRWDKEEPSDNLTGCFCKLTMLSEILGHSCAAKLLHMNLWSD